MLESMAVVTKAVAEKVVDPDEFEVTWALLTSKQLLYF